MNKKSFILHLDSLIILDEMTQEQKGILFDAIYKYQLGIEVELDFSMKMAFAPFKNQFIRDNEKYGQFIEKQKINGSKGGRKPKKPKPTQKTQANPLEPKKAYNDSVSVNDSDNDNNNVSNNILLTPLEIKFNEFLLFRKQIKKPIVKASEEAFKKKLYDLSGQNEEMAIKILDQSIANGWQGIFELKTKINGNSNNNSGINKQSERIKQNLATAAKVLAKLNGTGTENN